MYGYIAILQLYMEGKAIKNTIGIFSGKQTKHNFQVLTLLYDNEPLSAWELTAKLTNVGKTSLHATLNKRLRNLEKKGYIHRKETKWHLRFKGIIAVLLIQREPKMWNPKWTEIFKKNAEIAVDYSTPILNVDRATIQNGLKALGLTLDDFDVWVNLSKKVKELMNKGVINLDIIKQETLLAILILETQTIEQLSGLFKERRV